VREHSCTNLDRLGIRIDPELNNAVSSSERFISPEDAPVKAMVIPTNEELMIARETVRILSQA
jgi:Acetate kinase